MQLLKITTLRPVLLLTALLLLLLGVVQPALAQRRKPPRPKARAGNTNGKGDFFRIKTPTMRYVRPDTTTIIETEELPEEDSDAMKSIYFNPAKELSIVSEDTTTLDLGNQEIVEMSEEVLIDSSWIKVAGYYSIWDTRVVNPYRTDGRRIKDTLELKLTDPPRERYAKMPLHTTPITSGFAFRGYRWHFGVDLDLETGDSVKAVFDGVVRMNKWDGGGYGNYILVRHYNGLETIYGHLSKALVPVGTFVKAGQLIGRGGSTGRSTGSHLHFEVRYEGNPIDPTLLYNFPGYELRGDNFTITSALFNYYNRALRAKRSSGGGSSGSRSSGQPSGARRTVTHTIRKGDTLSEIAEKYGVGLSTIKRLNPGLKTLQLGKKVRIK
ncbi:peptidoglycan DD-metalloendopeptidase family protein [Hymenobacter sp. ASUV-10]|uniref:Peptidoglycan DD-metalloendopeptidase family protein n=1 Tax=Hymenobacter aranciens TaxID=3063996 RepID=A0ABT9B5Z5_9BACT|nr:peptidoglycan DD-metalloendopeptidase family protein [Hymenobacter sp. ASUV-10]MDO7873696.1 peptidoglycan DD-metalloendopeptidase family protein [Hymenobacter sp. ASUV-10]